MRLSKFTIVFGLYIIISASFARQVWDFFNRIAGQNNARLTVVLLFCVFGAFMLIYVFKSACSLPGKILKIVILCLALAYAAHLKIFV